MLFDSDVVLIGTGVAPLIAAREFLSQGKSVLVLNPDWDFFLEDSETSLDPWMCVRPTVDRLKSNLPEESLARLRPSFPGAVELWPLQEGFHDPFAPHVRQRSLLWMTARGGRGKSDDLESFFIEASDAGMNAQLFEGLSAAKRFPGFSAPTESGGPYHGVYLPRFCDVDVSRYRNGVLEFVRERLGDERVVSGAGQIEFMPGGIRFHAKGESSTAVVKSGILIFWTPRLSNWIFSQAKRLSKQIPLPTSVRLWEQWSLISRDALDPSTVGIYQKSAAWAEAEGAVEAAEEKRMILAVMRAGATIPLEQSLSRDHGWADESSFSAISELCMDFLRWDRYTVRSLKTRALFEWPETPEAKKPWNLSGASLGAWVVPQVEGALMEVVGNAVSSCKLLEEAKNT